MNLKAFVSAETNLAPEAETNYSYSTVFTDTFFQVLKSTQLSGSARSLKIIVRASRPE